MTYPPPTGSKKPPSKGTETRARVGLEAEYFGDNPLVMFDDELLLLRFRNFAPNNLPVANACDDMVCAISLYGYGYVRGWDRSVLYVAEGGLDGGVDMEGVDREVGDDENDEYDIIDMSDEWGVQGGASPGIHDINPPSLQQQPQSQSHEFVVVLVWMLSSLISLFVMAGYMIKSNNNNNSGTVANGTKNETADSIAAGQDDITTWGELQQTTASAQKGEGGREVNGNRRRSSLRSNKSSRNSL